MAGLESDQIEIANRFPAVHLPPPSPSSLAEVLLAVGDPVFLAVLLVSWGAAAVRRCYS